MKILILDYDDLKNPYAAGGQAYATSELARRLSRQHELTVVTGNYPSAANQHSPRLTYRRLGWGQFGFTISLLTHWLLLPWYVWRHQSEYSVILECFTSPFTVSLVPLVARKPLVALPTFFDSEMLTAKYHLPLHLFKRWLLTKYSRFICLTPGLARRIRRQHPQAACTVIPGGVDSQLLIRRPGIPGKYALYLGRIDLFNKGLEPLLYAWQQFSFPLYIAGSGRPGDIRHMQHLIQELHLNTRVKYLGAVNGVKKYQLLHQCRLVVLPSFYETFSFVALEALAAGKVLICFAIPGLSWIPARLAVKVRPFTAQALAKKLSVWLNQPHRLSAAAIPNRIFAASFTWNRIAAAYADYLSRI